MEENRAPENNEARQALAIASNLYCHLFSATIELTIAMFIAIPFVVTRSIGGGFAEPDYLRAAALLASYRILMIEVVRLNPIKSMPLWIGPFSFVFLVSWIVLKWIVFVAAALALAWDLRQTSARLKSTTGRGFDRRALPRVLGGDGVAFAGCGFYIMNFLAYTGLLICFAFGLF